MTIARIREISLLECRVENFRVPCTNANLISYDIKMTFFDVMLKNKNHNFIRQFRVCRFVPDSSMIFELPNTYFAINRPRLFIIAVSKRGAIRVDCMETFDPV